MKNNRNWTSWRRGLALLLAVCLAAGYVPVLGHAEGCTHEHGEECYEVTAQCLHTHDESCYTDPALMEAGEEADACGHECTEETGCVVKTLNCGHVHDEVCGETVEEPKEEPEGEPQGEPEPQPEEPKEEPQPELEAPKEPQAKTVTAWTWIDEAEVLDLETGKLCLVASEEEPISFDQIVEVLPKAIEATVDGEGETLPLTAWTCAEYPEDGAYEGSFVLEAELPEGYALGDGVEALTVDVEFGGAVVMTTNPVAVIVDDTTTEYGTINEAIDAANGATGQSVTVKLLGNTSWVGSAVSFVSIVRDITLDLNGCQLNCSMCQLAIQKGKTLTLKDSQGNGVCTRLSSRPEIRPDDTDYSNEGTIRIESGKWENCYFFLIQGKFEVSGGSVYMVQAEAAQSVIVRDGTIRFLAIGEKTDVNLSGGFFGDIYTSGKEIAAKDILDPGYLLQQLDDEGKYNKLRYNELPIISSSWVTGTSVVKCNPHVFETGNPNCIYCNTPCDHKTADLTTGKCPCGQVQLYQAKIGDTGYATLEAALTEAQKTEGSTVTLLCDVSGEYTITGGNFTLDLNGRTISSSGKTICLTGGALTLTDSGTGGRVTGNVAVYMSDGELNIQGGTYAGNIYGLHLNPYSTGSVSISGGIFENIGLADSVDGNLVDCLAPNHAFYADPDGKTIVNAAVKELSGTVYVREHTSHTFDADGACPCGYQCPHTEAVADMTTGKCACGKVQIYEAKIGDTGYGSLGGAMDAAEERPGCTVTLLCDVSNEESGRADTLVVRSGGYTLDLNGHKVERTIGENLTIWVSGNLVIVDSAGGGQIANTCGNSAIDIPEGSLTIQGGTVSGDVTAGKAATLTISGGAFMGKLRHTKHNLVEDLADGCAFYADPDGKTIVSGAAEELTGPLYVRKGHSHRYVNGKCDCGRCSHISVDMDTGKCAQCGYQVYLAKVGENQGYATLREALSAVAQMPNSTVTLLADVNVLEEDTNYCYVLDTGTFTLNLNGRKIINDEDTNYGMEIFRIQGANLTIEGDAPGSEIRRAEWGVSAIALNSGSLTIRGGKIAGKTENISTAGGELTISGGTFDGSLYISAKTTAAVSGGSFSEIWTDHDSLLDVLAPDYAFFDADSGKILDASGTSLKIVCVREHTHDFAGKNKCPCGYQCPHRTVNQTTGACETCGKVLYDARLTIGETSTLHESMNDAFRELGERAGTVTLLRDVNVAYFSVYQNNVLDGNGHTINGALMIDLGTENKSGGVIRNVTLKEGPEVIRGYLGIPVFGDNCVIYGFHTSGGELLALVQDSYAFFTDEGCTTFADPTLNKTWDVLYTGPHTHKKQADSIKCACGYTFPTATVTQAPAPLALTYTGQPQDLVTAGTAQGGTLVYSLTEKGTYTQSIPTGALPKTYTVYYKVQGDDSHLDTEPQKVSVTIRPTNRYLDLTDTGLTGTITVGGKDYPIEETDGKRFVTLPEEGDLFTAYTYGGDPAHPYPTGMNVYAIERKTTGSTATEIPEFRNLLTYAGCSIRISGKQGIRMITSLDEATKKALTGKGLAGYTLEEYGTVVSWTGNLGNGSFLRLEESYARSNYAYLKGKADPVFARKNGILQYTNVLLLNNLTAQDYDKDLTLRAYIKLKDASGNIITLYGGTVTRSIYYVATQNADTYKPGTTGYKFVHKIIDAVEGRS